MKVYLINLDRSVDRLKFMTRQLADLKIDFERVAAVDGMPLSTDIKRESVNRFRWWCAVGRSPSPAEIGCAKSHYGIYEGISEPVCVLEDDIEISPDFAAVLERVAAFVDPSRPQVVLLSDRWGRRQEKDVSGNEIVRSQGGLFTDGYVITPPAARALLRHNRRLEVPCDWWGRWVRRGAIELYHAPTVVRQRREQFGSSTSALRASRPRLPLFRRVLHKGVRAVGRAVDAVLEELAKDG